jgi:hypothetical protein
MIISPQCNYFIYEKPSGLLLGLSVMSHVTPPGLIGLIAYLYHQVATSFLEAHLQRTLGLSVLGPEQFQDG